MRAFFISSCALVFLACSASVFAAEKKVTRLGEGGKGFKNTKERNTSSNKMHGIGDVETHYLLMIMDYDKQGKSYIVANKEQRREVEKELAFERRYFSRILAQTKQEWQQDEETRHQRFPYLSYRRLSVRGTYRSASEAQAKMQAAQEADGRYEKKKQESDDWRKNQNGKNNRNKNNNMSKRGNNKHGQVTFGEERTVGRVTEKKEVIRLGNSSDGALGRVKGSDIPEWEPDKAMAVASERIREVFKQYVSNQGPPETNTPITTE
jgi:hypothetical protein